MLCIHVLTIGNNTLTTYHLKGVQLLNANIYRDLGMLVGDHCLFKQHILSICCKAYNSIINVIFCCFHSATLMLSLRHINHLSALCWNTAPQYGTPT